MRGNSNGKELWSKNLDEWVSEDGKLDLLVNKFAEKSLDIRPFLNRVGLLKQEVFYRNR